MLSTLIRVCAQQYHRLLLAGWSRSIRGILSGVVTAGGLATLGACGDKTAVVQSISPLQKWIEANQYTPFTVARNGWGPGTVVDFTNKTEEIVAFDNDCLQLQQKNLINTTDAALVSGTYTVNDSGNADLNLARGFQAQVDLKGAFKDSRVHNIRVSLGRTQEQAASITALKERAAALAEAHQDTCVNTLFSRENAIICRVLVIDGLSYDFEGSHGSAVNLDAQLLQNIGISGAAASELGGKSGLHAQKPLLVGYRLCRLKAQAGLAVSDMAVEELNPSQVLALKTRDHQ